jgi:transposase
METKRIATDTSKSIFALHAIDASDRPILRRDIKRSQVEPFFAKLPPTEIVLEACGASHHWGRLFTKLGHKVRLIPPQYVKPFVKRGKSDRADAQAICEAAGRPDMRFVAVKSADQQAKAMVITLREQFMGQRTALINALRGHAGEFGVIAAKGTAHVGPLLAQIAKPQAEVPPLAQEVLAMLGEQITALDRQIAALDAKLHAMFKASETCKRLAKIPGVGELTALAMTLTVDFKPFESGRHFAAWLGLTPLNRSTGGKQRLGHISKAGNERLRSLMVLGATSVIKVCTPGSNKGSPWLKQLLERKPRKLAAVALANKMARIIWAMMASGKAYRGASAPTPVAA